MLCRTQMICRYSDNAAAAAVMIRIAEAFEAISRTLPQGSVTYKPQRTAQGGYFIWLDRATVNKLERLRGRGEDISDVSCGCLASMRPTSRSRSFCASSGANSGRRALSRRCRIHTPN